MSSFPSASPPLCVPRATGPVAVPRNLAKSADRSSTVPKFPACRSGLARRTGESAMANAQPNLGSHIRLAYCVLDNGLTFVSPPWPVICPRALLFNASSAGSGAVRQAFGSRTRLPHRYRTCSPLLDDLWATAWMYPDFKQCDHRQLVLDMPPPNRVVRQFTGLGSSANAGFEAACGTCTMIGC